MEELEDPDKVGVQEDQPIVCAVGQGLTTTAPVPGMVVIMPPGVPNAKKETPLKLFITPQSCAVMMTI